MKTGTAPSDAIGVDIGGTFTDVIFHGADGRVATAKVLSTPSNYGDAILAGIAQALAAAGRNAADIGRVAHGSTIASNAVLEGSAAAPALIATAGFRDVIGIGRLRLPKLYDVTLEKPPPLVPRHLRFEVAERIGADGSVVAPLDAASVAEACEAIRASGVKSVAVSLLNSFANPEHEQAVAAALRERLPDVDVSIGSDISRQIREVERTSTAVVNAYLRPVLQGYLGALRQRLEAAGVNAPLFISQSTGGLTTADRARRLPVTTLESGPAAGVVAAAALAKVCGVANMISFDMGGTTAKAASIENGAFVRSADFVVGGGIIAGSRLLTGAGHPLQTPAIDLAEVGAGGGSIIRIDRGGALTVGPESAGSSPGPVCYGRGGDQPTITDAAAALGFLNPRGIAGGAIAIDVDAAKAAIAEKIARPLKLAVEDAAFAAIQIGNAKMLRALRAVSSERGRDPREATICVFGGNGPLFGPILAAELGARRVLAPMHSGIFSAVGLLAAECEFEASETFRAALSRLSADDLQGVVDKLEAAVHAELAAAGFPKASRATEVRLSVRYIGQTHALTVPVVKAPGGALALADLDARFAREHERTYGHRGGAAEGAEITTVHVVGRGSFARPRETLSAPVGSPSVRTTRPVYFGPRVGWLKTPILTRAQVGASTAGPCIVEDYDATCLVPPGATASLDARGILLIDLPPLVAPGARALRRDAAPAL